MGKTNSCKRETQNIALHRLDGTEESTTHLFFSLRRDPAVFLATVQPGPHRPTVSAF